MLYHIITISTGT